MVISAQNIEEMTVAQWSQRTFSSAQGTLKSALADRFGHHQLQMFEVRDMVADRKEMMLVETPNTGQGSSIVYMALPDGERMYDGFVPIAFTDVPPDVCLWIGDDIGYHQLFKK